MAKAMAKLQYLHMAPRKVRLIADTVRGLHVNEAEAQLMHRPHRAAAALLKLLRSCIANARNSKMDVTRLVVEKITVDQGPMLKRSLPRAMGRATPIQKKMSHVFLALADIGPSHQRFVIAPPKKEKKIHEHRKRQSGGAVKAKEEPKNEKSGEQVGFLKRIFRRKSV